MSKFDIYVGDGKPRADVAHDLTERPEVRSTGRYLASTELAEAVNISLAVGQPLLVTGEPGCGKTTLAWSVAHELNLGEPLVFFTRSSSRAQDLLYRYDAVMRFHDIQVHDPRARRAQEYVRWEALGEAIRSQTRRVVLIDEIDKAPRDFPNDLLNELDKMEFTVPELMQDKAPDGADVKSSFKATARPIVIITSNTERQLPLPFLRRCVFHHIDFPEKRLREIATERLGELRVPPDLLASAVDKFIAVRKVPGLVKKPATGEFLAWVQALALKDVTGAALAAVKLSALPCWQVLIKDFDDWTRLRES
jgi:MoxR-like ATPase